MSNPDGRPRGLFAGALFVCLLLVLSPAAAETVLLEFGSTMTYLDNQSDPGINMTWTDPEFDDSGWSTGQYGVGYENSSGAENLLLTTVPALTTRSVYTRVSFNIENAGMVQNLILGADYDDGYVAWINGVEVFRGNMTTGNLHWNSLTGGEHESSNGAVPFYELQDISATGLQALHDGENILAVGVWNIGIGSSDLVLVPQLTIDKTLEVTRGPYLQIATDDSIVIRWRTNIATDSHVEYGSQPGSLNQSVNDPLLMTEHSVTLTGLSADTPFYYAIGSSTEILAGDDAGHFFHTNPTPGTRKPIRVWVLGDSGYGSQNQADVRDAYLTYTGSTRTDLWLHVGDVSQSTGTDAQYQTEFFDMYPGLLRQNAFWPTFGNHDSANANSSTQSGPYYENFTLPANGEAGGFASGTEAYYSFNYANVHFVVLNSADVPRTTGSAMLTWLETDLADTAQDWIIAYWHHPPYSKGSHDSDTEVELIEMRQYVVPILEDYGVDLAFSGHSHSYERTYLIDGHYGDSTTFDESHKVDGGDGSETGDGAYQKSQIGPDPHQGTVYTVAGTGGQVYGGSLDYPAMYISWNVLGSVVLDINEDRLDARYLDSTGSVLDEYTIIKGVDQDEDGVPDDWDNCTGLFNPAQEDSDSDGLGNACDNCPYFPNADQTNSDSDLLGDFCDPCPADGFNDADWDGLCGNTDNCPFVANPGQEDLDSDGIGDACDIDDDDSDGVSNISDCDPLACGLSAAPGEIGQTLRLDKRAGGTLTWSRAVQGHTSNIYRGQVPAHQPFTNNATCFHAETPETEFADGEALSPWELFFYLVTARNDCGESSAGPGRSLSPCGIINNDSDGDGTSDLKDNCAGVHDPSLSDMDKDFVGDVCDNCDAIYNPSQEDSDSDGIGNACEGMDADSDGVPDFLDNCALISNPDQSDADSDGDGDVCDNCTDTDIDSLGNPGFPANSCPLDNCPRAANPAQADADSDTLGDLCDVCAADANNDVDDDAVCADADNCPFSNNAGQEDLDSDDLGDVCDGCPIDPANDIDSDSYCADADNCPVTTNSGQEDADTDGAGDVCDVCVYDPDNDIDSDSFCADVDNCPGIPNSGQADADTDGAGDICDDCMYDPDNDMDSDSLCGDVDNCPAISNPGQADADTDGAGDICDNCADIPNPDQSDIDEDGMGSACDNCPKRANPGQADGDSDSHGDACDNCPVIANGGQEDADAGDFGAQQIISTAANGAQSVWAADLDGDGDTDLISASYNDSKVAWHENSDGQGSFGPQQVISTAAKGAYCVCAADLDGDHDIDVISASYYDDTIAWYENIDGAGTFGPLQVISTQADFAKAVFAADIDGDGDIDVLSASYNDNKIAWYENIDGAGTFGSQQVISTLAHGGESVFAADIDSDGDLDVLAASSADDEVAWYENIDGNGSFGAQQLISSAADSARAVLAADIDGDGDVDVLSASFFDDKIAWYENVDGAGAFGMQRVISIAADGAYSVFATDLDGDGDTDVLSASHFDNKIAWYENIDGLGNFGPQQVITTSVTSGRSVIAAYVDSDNLCDAISASNYDDKIAWYKNGDGVGDACDNCTTIPNPGQEDADSDGDGDACDSCPNDPMNDIDSDGMCGDVDVCPNDPLNDIDSDAVCGDVDNCPDTANATQLDSDSDGYGDACDSCINDPLNDVDSDGVCGNTDNCPTVSNSGQTDTDSDGYGDSCDNCLYMANGTQADGDSDGVGDACDNCPTDANSSQTDSDIGDFGSRDIIFSAARNANSVFAADIDGDGDPDVLSASYTDSRVAWYENLDGAGSFGSRQTISTEALGAWSIFAGDIDSDGDLDVLSASYYDDKIAWYENSDGGGTFGPLQVISTAADFAKSVYAADVDGDGDLDVLSASKDDDKIAWYENTDGAGTFGSQQVISTAANGAESIFAADIDSDGDIDVLSASPGDDEIAWYENIDGAGTFGSQQIISTAADGAKSVFAADIDGDGDLDVLSASLNDDEIAWYENMDGDGTFGSQQVISTAADGASAVVAVDVDGDGDLDVLSASSIDDKIAWYENMDGAGTFGAQQVISTVADGARSVFAIDLDNDGLVDALSASADDNTVAWYKNGDALGDACDNCPYVMNPGQEDADSDGIGDACDF